MLKTYFRSGWAFFIPYLAAYLLYAWLKWPVHPRAEGWAPCLLHVYWVLHALHLGLGVVALLAWCRAAGSARISAPALWSLTPWLLLALAFWIPGIYLEWPADPWEHLRRINEWGVVDQVTAHSTWSKSSYFLPYSLTGHATGLTQLGWLNVYCTAICLLLGWQYYRLARIVGLGKHAAFIFVVLQSLLLGNNAFSLHRYYGLSSSLPAQLSMIAFLNLVAVAARHPRVFRGRWLQAVFGGGLLAGFMDFNHPQAAGAAALGVAGVLMWRLLDWKPVAGWILIAVLALACLVPLGFYPAHRLTAYPAALEPWVSPWLGFKVLSPGSPAADRLLQIVGAAGLLNFLAALLLLRRNQLAAWLTLAPVLVLCLPYVALPLANVLFLHNNIVTVQRMYFAIPVGLALVHLIHCGLRNPGLGLAPERRSLAGFGCALAACALVVMPSPARPTYNHAWNALAVTPPDLSLAGLAGDGAATTALLRTNPGLRTAGADAPTSVLETLWPSHPAQRYRPISQPVTISLQEAAGVPFVARAHVHGMPRALNADPLTHDPAAWSVFAGSAPRFVADVGDLPGVTTALQSAPGETLEIFSAALIPVDPAQPYRLEMTLKQEAGGAARAQLAVAWYDAAGRLLVSGESEPAGAGHPSGWRNGTYSYFGPVGADVPRNWVTYRVSFGPGEGLVIPRQARAVRVGALLNTPAAREATLRLSNVRLWRKSPAEQMPDGAFTGNEDWLVIAPAATNLLTPASQAAQLAQHWLPQQVAMDFAGGPELQAQAGRGNAATTRLKDVSLHLYRRGFPASPAVAAPTGK